MIESDYRQFQFDRSRKPIEIFPEVKPLLEALSPDESGWDRLQWTLQPHEGLSGRTEGSRSGGDGGENGTLEWPGLRPFI